MSDFPIAEFERDADTPMYAQLYEALRAAILEGRLARGSRLPSTRRLQSQLGVSRNTVLRAVADLYSEGYLRTSQGSGTYVADNLPEDLSTAVRGTREPSKQAHLRLSRVGELTLAQPRLAEIQLESPKALYPGVPDIRNFPLTTWRRLWDRRLSRRPNYDMYYYSAHSYQPLQNAIAEHVSVTRGVSCRPEQVVVVTGSQQGLTLAARLLVDPGEEVWMEDPGYPLARGAFGAAGASVRSFPVDSEGLDLDQATRGDGAPARLVYVTPSHQHPLGPTMSMSRRRRLLDWANDCDAWIIEDDYDSDFRYSGRPLPALQGLDSSGRVLYLGTFSKVLFPALRIGYMVVPEPLVDPLATIQRLTERHLPTLDQAVLADFIGDGHLSQHIRRMRELYARRRDHLIAVTGRIGLDAYMSVDPADAGMHLIGWLKGIDDDAIFATRCHAAGVSLLPLSRYVASFTRDPALVLGYTAYRENEITAALQTILALARG